jgi:hypothetical protein
MALLKNLPGELLVAIISNLQADLPLLCSLALQCRQLSTLVLPFLFKYTYLNLQTRSNKHILHLKNIKDNSQLLYFIRCIGIPGMDWDDPQGKELIGRLEKVGVVFWSLPPIRFCGHFRPRMEAGCFPKKVYHHQSGIG